MGVADDQGYTGGAAVELAARRWSLRLAAVTEPVRSYRSRGSTLEWEGRMGTPRRPGAVRLLAFLNRERATADSLPASRAGFGVNVEQTLTADIGAFARYGWNNGRTETWEFTGINRSWSGGAAMGGRAWRRSGDRVGFAFARNYLAGCRGSSLAASVVETYYAVPLGKGFTLTADYQRIINPGHYAGRGLVNVAALRMHWEAGWSGRGR